MRQVFNWSGDFRPIGNGIWWNIREDCDQFTLTMEQLAQKEEKRTHAVKYLVIKDYNGSTITCSYGCKTFCCGMIYMDSFLMLICFNNTILSSAM